MLDENMVDAISATYRRGKSIRRNLAGNSKIVIDHKLPYLCVYRFSGAPDPTIAALLKTQGAYLIADVQLPIEHLLQTITDIAFREFKSFILIEIWPEDKPGNRTISILYPKEKYSAAIKSLEKGFMEFNQLLAGLKVALIETDKRYPSGTNSLIPINELAKTGTLLIGITIPPIFNDADTNQYFPIFFRRIARKFADIIKVAVFEFIRLQADNKFEHYLMLGKTRLDNLVRSADKKIAAISENMNFIMRVTPVNTADEWKRFKEKKYSVLPQFNYRLISLDPEIEKRKLYDIPLENIENPTLAFLLRDKRIELEKQLLMLEERGTKKFFFTSCSIFGEIEDSLRTTAISILDDEKPNEQQEFNTVDAGTFTRKANEELDKYRTHFPHLDLSVRVKDNVTGLLVSGPELSVGTDLNISEPRMEALIQHEVGTHMLTYCNGHAQPLHLMYAGFAGYEQIQEGIAVLSEYMVDGLNQNRLKLLAARVMAVDTLMHGADFVETYRVLTNTYNFSRHTAFNISMRVHRGGGYTKDVIYLRGLLELLSFLKEGGNIRQLYAGKFALEHMPLIDELTHLKILRKPVIPGFLTTEKAKEKLAILKNGIQLNQLVSLYV